MDTAAINAPHSVQPKYIINNESYRNAVMHISKKYGNAKHMLPEKNGREYYQASANGLNGHYVIFSNDGLCFITYNNFKTIFPIEDIETSKKKAAEKELNFFDSFKTEIELYNQNNMAPMAYTYIMQNIYDWYLSDSTAERAMIERRLNIFKDTGYKITGIDFYDNAVNYLPEKPKKLIDSETHYFRNELNIEYEWDDFNLLNKKLPKQYRWEEMTWPGNSMHQNTSSFIKPNRKYVSFDGYFEIVYSYDNILLNEKNAPEDMGTYNYSPSTADDGFAYIKHSKDDVAPYNKYKNTEEEAYSHHGKKRIKNSHSHY